MVNEEGLGQQLGHLLARSMYSREEREKGKPEETLIPPPLPSQNQAYILSHDHLARFVLILTPVPPVRMADRLRKASWVGTLFAEPLPWNVSYFHLLYIYSPRCK